MSTIAKNVRDTALKTVEKTEELDEQYGVKSIYYLFIYLI